MKTAHLTTLLTAALLAPPVLAVQIAYEPFGAYNQSALSGQNPPITGFSGPWTQACCGTPNVVSPGLTVPGLPTTGDAVTFPAGTNGRVGRLLSTRFDDAYQGTVYISAILQLDAVSSAYRALELHFGGFDDNSNRTLQIATGEPADGAINTSTEIGFRVNRSDDAAFGAFLGNQTTDPELYIIRIDFTSADLGDVITVYKNPTDLQTEANNTGSFIDQYNFRFDRVSLARFGGDNITFDEIRIGTTFNDVTGVVDTDADNDGMDDAWEALNNVDDPAGNPDGDELTNLQEFENQTNPNLADSDDDGIDDHAELDGTGNAFNNIATDPNNPDSDGDRTNDGDEVGVANRFITDPNNPDTDNDGESDTTELANNTNPLDNSSNAAALGIFLTDGIRDTLYGQPLAVQQAQTGFGDNFSELDAAYAAVKDGKLNLLLTGNLESNFNKLHIFLDTIDGGENPLLVAGNDNAFPLDNLEFDTGFIPDFHLIARRGTDKFDLDIANLDTAEFAFYERIFGDTGEGSGETTNPPTDSTYTTDPSPVRVAYDGSNEAGIGGTATEPADQDAARAVATGIELQLDLADIGSPTAEIRILAFVTSSDHNTASNQFLGALPAGTENLGAPGSILLGDFEGDQFFTVPLTPAAADDFRITAVTPDSGAGQLSLTFPSTPGEAFQVESSPDGKAWTTLPGTTPASAGTSTTITVAIPSTATALYRVRRQ